MMSDAMSPTGVNVYHMPQLMPELMDRLFPEVEVSSSADLNAMFLCAEIGELSLIRAIHSSRNCQSVHIKRNQPSRRQDFVFACMPISGTLELQHIGRSCEVREGSVAFLSTKDDYFIKMSDQIDAFWLRIPAPLLQTHSLTLQASLCQGLSVSSGIGIAATQLMHASMASAGQLGQRGASLLSHSLLGFFGELLDSTASETGAMSSGYRAKIIARARDYIDSHIADENLSPDRIAQGIGISRRYLSQIFASQGLSVMRWVQQRRLELCRIELERNHKGQLSIQEIAYSMGFSNISSFNRAFKARYGTPPKGIVAPLPVQALSDSEH